MLRVRCGIHRFPTYVFGNLDLESIPFYNQCVMIDPGANLFGLTSNGGRALISSD